MWNACLSLGKLEIAVKLYAAAADAAVHFHLLHDRDHERVRQQMVNPVTGRAVPRDQIRKGYEIVPGTFVLLTNEELRSLEPPASRSIQVESFVPEDAIEPVWFERPYYLGPNGKSPEYFALAAVLAERKIAGLARWVLRKRPYHGALRARDGYLTLSSLHSRQEVAEAPKVAPGTREMSAKELRMAEQLVDALAGEFDPAAFRDEHRERVLELIAAKAKGKSIELPARARKRPARPLAAALEQSLRQVKKLRGEERLSA